MYSQVTAQLRLRGEQLLTGRLEDLLSSYQFPLAVFLPSHRMVLGPNEAHVALAVLRRALVARGVVALRPQVTAVELPRGGRFRVWVDWHELAVPVEETRISQAIYYCRATELGVRIEMVNYTRVSMPELHQEFEALALSA